MRPANQLILFFILFLIALSSRGQKWSAVGDTAFTSSGVKDVKMSFQNGFPFVIYKGEKSVSIERFNGKEWVGVGSTGFSDKYDDIHIASGTDGHFFVLAETKKGNRFEVREFADGQWTQGGMDTPADALSYVREVFLSGASEQPLCCI
ncbi:MAG: hypothetical protein ABEH38_08635 [Flavobacteriales bacterium]